MRLNNSRNPKCTRPISHEPPPLRTARIPALSCTTLWHLQVHPNTPTHPLPVCMYKKTTAGTHTPGLSHTVSARPISQTGSPKESAPTPTLLLSVKYPKILPGLREGAERVRACFVAVSEHGNVGVFPTHGEGWEDTGQAGSESGQGGFKFNHEGCRPG